jgi:hypothetical protein
MSPDSVRRTGVLEKVAKPARQAVAKSPKPVRPRQVCAGCAAEIEGGAVLRNGLLYCSFECAAYVAAKVPGLYLG